MTRDELLSVVRNFMSENNRESATFKEISEATGISRWQFQKYGGFVKIIQELGYKRTRVTTKEELYEKVKKYIEKIGHVPRQLEFTKNKIADNKTFDRFGGYKKVLSELGYEYPKWRAEDYTKEEMKEIFIKAYGKKAPPLKQVEEDYTNGLLPFSSFVIRRKFGTMNALAIYCGMEINMFEIHYYNNEEVKEMFIEKYGNNTPPMMSEVDEDYKKGLFKFSSSMLAKKFKTYNKFLVYCSYELSSGYFGHPCVAEDEHLCDSKTEKIIDDFMYQNNIKHERNPKYKEFINGIETTNKADWILEDNTIIEYFGLMGNNKYEQKVRKKLDLLNKNKINYIAIYPEDLNKLEVIFMYYLNKGGINNVAY